ncbi:MAG TPA: hypothetical protein PK288_10305, partial [Bacteroidales bacterium]|nr:hypothetical protein [Bacteroidales bacterium]
AAIFCHVMAENGRRTVHSSPLPPSLFHIEGGELLCQLKEPVTNLKQFQALPLFAAAERGTRE